MQYCVIHDNNKKALVALEFIWNKWINKNIYNCHIVQNNKSWQCCCTAGVDHPELQLDWLPFSFFSFNFVTEVNACRMCLVSIYEHILHMQFTSNSPTMHHLPKQTACFCTYQYAYCHKLSFCNQTHFIVWNKYMDTTLPEWAATSTQEYCPKLQRISHIKLILYRKVILFVICRCACHSALLRTPATLYRVGARQTVSNTCKSILSAIWLTLYYQFLHFL